MVLGSDLLTFRHSALPAPVSLAFVPEGGHLQPRQVLDWYLDNLLAGLSHTAVSTVQRDGQQQYTLVRTQDIPEWAALYAARTAAHPPMPSGFTATAVQERAAELLQFIKQTCTVDGGSYWLLRRQGDAELHLLQVTAAAKAGARGGASAERGGSDEDETGRATQLQWAYTASSVCTRLARQVAEVVAARAAGEDDADEIGSAALRGISTNSLLAKHVRLLSRAHDVASKAAVAAAAPQDLAAAPRGDGSVPLWVHMPWKRHYRASLCSQLVQGLAWQGIQLLQSEAQGADSSTEVGGTDGPGGAVDALNTAARYALWGLEMRRVTLRNECWAGITEWIAGDAPESHGDGDNSDNSAVARMVLSFPPVQHGAQQVVEMQAQLVVVASALSRALLREGLVHSAVRVLEDALTALRVPLLSDWAAYCGAEAARLPGGGARPRAIALAAALHDGFEAQYGASMRLSACLSQPVACEWLGVAPPGAAAVPCPTVGAQRATAATGAGSEGSPNSGSVACSAALFAAVGDVFTTADAGAAVPRVHGVSRRDVQWSRLPTLLATLQQQTRKSGTDRDESTPMGTLDLVLRALEVFRLPALPQAPQAMVSPISSRAAKATAPRGAQEEEEDAAAVSAVSLHVMAMHAYDAALLSMPHGWGRGPAEPASWETDPPLNSPSLTPLQFLALTQVQRKMADCCNRWGQRTEAASSAGPVGGGGTAAGTPLPPPSSTEQQQVLSACASSTVRELPPDAHARLASVSAFSRAAALMDSSGDRLNAALVRCNIAKVLFTVASSPLVASSSHAAVSSPGGGTPLLGAALGKVLPQGAGVALALMDTACELVQSAAASAAHVESRAPSSHAEAIGHVRAASTRVLLAAGAKLAETAFAACSAVIHVKGDPAHAGGAASEQGVFDNDVFVAAQRLARSAGVRLAAAGEAASAAVAACKAQFAAHQTVSAAAALANSQLLLATVQLQSGMAALASAALAAAPGLLEKPLVLVPEGSRASAARAFGRAVAALAEAVRPLGFDAALGGDAAWSHGLRRRCAQLLGHCVGMLAYCELLRRVHLHLPGQVTDAAAAAVPCSPFPPPLSLLGLLQQQRGDASAAVGGLLSSSRGAQQRDMATAVRGILGGAVQPGDMSAHVRLCMANLRSGGVSAAGVLSAQRETQGLSAFLLQGSSGGAGVVSKPVVTAVHTFTRLLASPGRDAGAAGCAAEPATGGDAALLLFPVSALLAAANDK